MQIKQVDYKVSTKIVNNHKYKTFRDIFGQLHKEYSHEKAEGEALATEKGVKKARR